MMLKVPVWTIALMAALSAGCSSGAASDTVATSSPQETPTALVTTTASPTTTTADPDAPTTTHVPVPPPTTTPPLPTTTTTTEPPQFEYTIAPATRETVRYTWREGCPLDWSELSLLTLTYWNFNGDAVHGQMVVNTEVADDVVTTFEGLFRIGFPIEHVALVDEYGGDDKAAMAANVTSGFNCRYVDGTERWSNHAFGLAVDINPLINPWARPDNVLPVEGTRYTDRSDPIPGMINEGDAIIDIFAAVGWSWGGVWTSPDYMHFSEPGN
jgi:hypothetical protein